MAVDEPTDGRHARRERNRAAVIDAVFALVQEGKVPPSVEDVAERAGTSVSSIFRNFDGLADAHRQALDTFQLRFAHLFDVDDAGDDRSARVHSHVRSRVELAEVAGGLIGMARARALEHQSMVAATARLRERLAMQTRERFASELAQLGPAEATSLLALLDSITSPEAFAGMSSSHARSSRQIAKTWERAFDALLEQWVPITPTTLPVGQKRQGK